MENLKKSIVPVLLSVVVAVAVSLSLATPSVQTIIKEKNVPVGSVSSPDISSPYFSYGDVRHWASKGTLVTATNTVCSLQSPASTSSLVYASISLDTATATASKIQFSNNPSNSGTSSNVLSTGLYSIGANVLTTFVQASTTPSPATVFAPNTYLTVGMYGTTNSTVSPTGNCKAVWLEY